MMAFEHIVQAQHMASASEECAGRRLAVIADLHRVADLLRRDEALADDAASLLLDGALSTIAKEWFALRGQDIPDGEHLLAELWRREGDAAPFVGRLRLALRAPDPHARLVQCWELLRCISQPSDNDHDNDVNNVE